MIMPSHASQFTFQTDWVERRGILLVLAFYLGGLGAGLYLMSLYFNFYAGMVVGFLIVLVGKSGAHLLYLGRPLRAWRGFVRPQSSWISRGLIAIFLFLIPAALQLASNVPAWSGLPWTSHNLALQVFVFLGAFLLMAYTGFALSSVRAIPAWNTSMMPVIFVSYSVLGGTGLGLGLISAIGNVANIETEEIIVTWLLIIVAVLMGIYLWATYYTSPAGRRSVRELVRGRASPFFLGGMVFLGLVVPLAVGITSLTVSTAPSPVAIAASACELIGGFSMRYSIFKAGVYAPVV
jgi:formate-dependent nitrite reductase membrane component NrfD